MTKLEFIDKINDILVGLNTLESDLLGSLYDEITAPAWVSVEERLPPRAEHSFIFSDYVLVCDNNGYMDTACYNFEKNRWDWLNNVTHWMPMPEAPAKKGGQDD